MILETPISDPNRDAVQARLEALGFVVCPIPETSKSQQPDLAAQADRATMYVEVKTRFEDRVLRDRMEAVGIGETADIFTDLGKQNRISSMVKHASSQLSAAASQNDFRLLWYRADRGLFVSNTKEQIVATLYGMRMVLAERPLLELRSWHCAYAGHADFFRFRQIDGVMVEVNGLISLFLNPFSPRSAAFAVSRIARVLRADDAVFDIQQMITDGKLFAADGDAPRRNDLELLAHLASKYPSTKFICFLSSVAVTTMTTIDGSQGGANNKA
ncbi:MAG: hypothetical protein MI685_04880 [Chlorobiales bacterium]|nr:hypothetical protein [Chlorobiales bacterium]